MRRIDAGNLGIIKGQLNSMIKKVRSIILFVQIVLLSVTSAHFLLKVEVSIIILFQLIKVIWSSDLPSKSFYDLSTRTTVIIKKS